MTGAGAATPRGGGTVDAVFGEIRWRCGPGTVVVRGEAVPEVAITRSATAAPQAWIPIGTRRATDLTMTVADRPVRLVPAKGGLSRRSYRVLVDTGSGPLLLTPNTPTASRLVRGTGYRGDNELGTVTHAVGNRVLIEWSEPVNVLGLEVDVLTPTGAEAAIGYALALAFGTGARFAAAALLSGIDRLLPG